MSNQPKNKNKKHQHDSTSKINYTHKKNQNLLKTENNRGIN